MDTVKYISTVVGIFTAIIGFYVTTVVEEIRSGVAVVYSVERSDGRAVLTVKNVSRVKPLSGAMVGLVCADFKPCFSDENPEDVERKRFQPVAGFVRDIVLDKRALAFRLDLVPGAKIEVSLSADESNTSDLIFQFLPAPPSGAPATSEPTLIDAVKAALTPRSPRPETPVFISGGTVTAWVVEAYFGVMASVMVISAVLLVGFMLAWGFLSWRATKHDKEDSDAAKVLSVDLVYRRHGPGAGRGDAED